MTWDAYRAKLRAMGGVVEAFVEGGKKRSPSAQYRVDPLGGLEVISTHDQVLGGRSGQIFLGCRFPADRAYRLRDPGEPGSRPRASCAARACSAASASTSSSSATETGWRHYAIEVNLRKGGTTHPFLMLQFLTDGRTTPRPGPPTPGRPAPLLLRTDNLQSERYGGLGPEDLIDIAVREGCTSTAPCRRAWSST